MSTKNWPLQSAKAYLLFLVGVFVACLFTAFAIAEVWRFCYCGDVSCLVLGGGALMLTVFFAVALRRFLIRNKDVRL